MSDRTSLFEHERPRLVQQVETGIAVLTEAKALSLQHAIDVLKHELLMLHSGVDTSGISGTDIDDIFSSALDGGITYWCKKAALVHSDAPLDFTYTSEALSHGREVELVDSFDGKKHIISRAKLEQGIRLAAAKKGQTAAKFIEDADAASADVAVQYAIFGEIVYG